MKRHILTPVSRGSRASGLARETGPLAAPAAGALASTSTGPLHGPSVPLLARSGRLSSASVDAGGMTAGDVSLARDRVKAESWRVDKYTDRRPERHRAEMALVERCFPEMPRGARVLDAPCGAGRVALWMARQGWDVSAMDLGSAAVSHTHQAATREHLRVRAQEGDIFHMRWADRHFRAVICFRLLHHFSDRAIRRQLVQELARVSGEHLLISYLSPWSATGLKRRLRARVTGKQDRQNHTPLAELVADLHEMGFALIEDKAQQRFFHSLHLARFLRVDR